MLKMSFCACMLMFAASDAVLGQSPAAAQSPPPAVDVPAAEIQKFINALPKDIVSDRPIRVADVGGYRVGVFAVFRPKSAKQDAVLHEVKTTEIYYMLEGTATLVTGGTLMDQRKEGTNTTVRGSRIDGGVTRRIAPGDVVIIPGRVPHWWTSLDQDIKYLIFRPDPESRLQLR